MRILQRIIIALGLLSLVSGCYWGISGRVIDAETQQPIEGAVVLAQWTTTHGIGLTYHTIFQTVETETDKQGKFSLPGALSPFVDEPVLIIYKTDYVAWRNDYVFPGFTKRKDYDVWKNSYVYRLERFKEGYSRRIHSSFLSHGIMSDDIRTYPKFNAAENYEGDAALREIEKKQSEQPKHLNSGSSR